jgi:diguanylate cyclase (GGDEF)-like protein
MCASSLEVIHPKTKKRCYFRLSQSLGSNLYKNIGKAILLGGHMKMRDRTGSYILGFFIALLALIGLIYAMLQLQKENSQIQDVSLLASGWNIELQGKNLENVDLTEFRMNPLDIGEEVVLQLKLPKETPKQASIHILVHHSLVSADINGVEIYRYGQTLNLDKELAGSGYHKIYLGSAVGGDVLSIHIISTKKDAFSSFSPVYMGQEEVLLQKFILDRQFVIFANVFLVMIGIVFLMIALTVLFVNRSALKLLYIGLFSINIGIWASCNFQLFSILFNNKPLNVTIEYLALYLAPVFTGLLFLESFQRHKTERRIFTTMTLVNVAFFLIATTFHFSGVVQLPELLQVCHGIILIDIIVLFFTVIHNFKQRQRSEKLFLYGLSLFVLVAFSDVILYNLAKYHPSFQEDEFTSFSPWGAVIFVIMLLISYLFEIYDKNTEVKEKEFLERMAYTDYMTQISNRAKCTLVLEELDKREASYGIISLDLNDLKRVNDTFGHQAGDTMIMTLATILKKIFPTDVVVGRMGGDEFLVILMNGQEKHMVELLEQFQKQMEEENKQNGLFKIHVSYGYALSSEEKGQTADQIYRRADERMYHMKEVYHKIHDRRRKVIDKEEAITVQSENSK